MMVASVRRLLAAAILSFFLFVSHAQSPGKKETPPYKISTSGKKITIKSSKAIQHVMLWTTDGNRVAEHKEINANTFTLDAMANKKTFFLMIGLEGGKVYTEKVGLSL